MKLGGVTFWLLKTYNIIILFNQEPYSIIAFLFDNVTFDNVCIISVANDCIIMDNKLKVSYLDLSVVYVKN